MKANERCAKNKTIIVVGSTVYCSYVSPTTLVKPVFYWHICYTGFVWWHTAWLWETISCGYHQCVQLLLVGTAGRLGAGLRRGYGSPRLLDRLCCW